MLKKSYLPSLLDIVNALDIAQLIPQEYAHYRLLVKESMVFFLRHLAPERLAVILSEQLQMPADTHVTNRIIALLRRCPTLHKLGQVLARDRRLAPDLREHLQGLELLAPTIPLADILPILQRELGARNDMKIGRRALAEASVAIVVPFVWHATRSSAPKEGVLKVLKPGIETNLQEELDIWSALGSFLEERCTGYGLPALNFRETLDSVRALVLNEIRLDQEQVHLDQAARFYADMPQIVIPRLLPFCTSRITAMERIHGDKVTETSGLSSDQRWRLATTMIEALIAKPFWQDTAFATFHADPHAGNLFADPSKRLAILDWSLVSQLNKTQREAIIQIVLGALTLDESRICHAVSILGSKPPEIDALRIHVAGALRRVRQGTFPGFDWLVSLLDQLATSSSMRFPENMTLFRKSLFTLSGVLKDVSSECSFDQVLLKTGILQFYRELVSRTWSFDGTCTFGTHVSNRDLWGLWTSLPLAATRFWIDTHQDLVNGG